MIHDEPTTELEIPGYKKSSSVVAIHPPKKEIPLNQQAAEKVTTLLDRVDQDLPWVLRLVAVVSLIILSLFLL